MFSHGFWLFVVGYLGCRVSSKRQMSLSNKHLKMGALPMPPFFVVQRGRDGQESYSGLLWDIVDYIQESRNCTITVVTQADGGFGNCFNNGTCNGILGMINRSEIDFSLGKDNESGPFYNLSKNTLRILLS